MNDARHTLDEVIGAKQRPSAEIAEELARSPAFHAALDRAIAETERAGTGHFGRDLRMALARELAEGRIEE